MLEYESQHVSEESQQSGQLLNKLKNRLAGVFGGKSNGNAQPETNTGRNDYNTQTPNKPAVRSTVKPDAIIEQTQKNTNGTSEKEEKEERKKERTTTTEVAEPAPIQESTELATPGIIKAKKRNIRESDKVAVSICIITSNQLSALKKCVHSILEHTVYSNYKLLIHTNACNDGTPQYLKHLAREYDFIHLTQSHEAEPHIQIYNNQIKTFPEDDIVLLSNQFTVSENWLTELLKTLTEQPKAGIIGSAIMFPNKKLREFGAKLNVNGEIDRIGTGNGLDRHGDVSETGFVSNEAMYLSRQTLRKTGLLDSKFQFTLFSGIDLCYSAKEYGINTLVTPNSVVITEQDQGFFPTDKKNNIDRKIDFTKFTEKHLGKVNGINWGLDNIKLTDIRKSLNNNFTDLNGKMIINGTQTINTSADKPHFDAIASYEDYLQLGEENIGVFRKRFEVEKMLSKTYFSAFRLPGHNQMVNKNVNYHVDDDRPFSIDGLKFPDFRNSLICDTTQTSSILRACSLLLNRYVDKNLPTCMMINELSAPLYAFYKKKIKTLNTCVFPHQEAIKSLKGIQVEKPAQLSFADGQFDLFISAEVLQFTPNYKQAFAEIYRCLKPGGTAILIMPFRLDQIQNEIRAVVNDSGSIKHLQTPLYFDDPALPKRQLLCFQQFGWEALNQLKASGFKEVKAHIIWSLYLGIMGDNVVITVQK